MSVEITANDNLTGGPTLKSFRILASWSKKAHYSLLSLEHTNLREERESLE